MSIFIGGIKSHISTPGQGNTLLDALFRAAQSPASLCTEVMEGCDVSTKVFILMQNKSLGACRLRFIISKMEDLLHTPDFFCRGIKTFVLTSQTFITSVHRDAGLWCCPELWRCRSMRALSRRARRAVGIYVGRQQTSLSLSPSLSWTRNLLMVVMALFAKCSLGRLVGPSSVGGEGRRKMAQ